eukprot:TRINITY_DN22789_c0_g1_i1.p1 TRINITY_DN22789_c0_g1~~TRINITY_DN22789_c0_g1_i1.p1  ORF type:complete len:351 (-),score=32.79 TRINITY_DN22789_c0_g1_i1:91-1101(-)
MAKANIWKWRPRTQTEERNPIRACCIHYFVAMYCFAKLVAFPLLLIVDTTRHEKQWAKVEVTSAARCSTCFHRAVDGDVPTGVAVELTDCFRSHGDHVYVKRPREASSGTDNETWTRSWHDYGKEWWNRHPLDDSPTRFDDRWLFPDFRHQQILVVGPWWPDFCILGLLSLCGIVIAGLVVVQRTSARVATVASSLATTMFVPYVAYRLAQNLGWQVVENCVYVFWRNDRFTSLNFWTMCVWYSSLGLLVFVMPVAKFRLDYLEFRIAFLCQVLFATAGLVLSLIFFVGVYNGLEVWFVIFIGGTCDWAVLNVAIWVWSWCFEVNEVKHDEIMSFS